MSARRACIFVFIWERGNGEERQKSNKQGVLQSSIGLTFSFLLQKCAEIKQKSSHVGFLVSVGEVRQKKFRRLGMTVANVSNGIMTVAGGVYQEEWCAK